jgi:hypothetical protein
MSDALEDLDDTHLHQKTDDDEAANSMKELEEALGKDPNL